MDGAAVTLEQALAELSTDNQRAFVQEYLIDLNATQAAIRAGYSQDSARQEGSRLLSHAAIQAALELAKEQRAKRVEITADRVLRELLALATSDLRKCFDPSGALLPPDSWPDDVAPAMASVEVEELFEGQGKDRTQIGFTKKVKLWDKNTALDKLGRHLGLWDKERAEVNINLLSHVTDADLDARISKRLPKEKNDEPQSTEPPREDGTPGAS